MQKTVYQSFTFDQLEEPTDHDPPLPSRAMSPLTSSTLTVRSSSLAPSTADPTPAMDTATFKLPGKTCCPCRQNKRGCKKRSRVEYVETEEGEIHSNISSNAIISRLSNVHFTQPDFQRKLVSLLHPSPASVSSSPSEDASTDATTSTLPVPPEDTRGNTAATATKDTGLDTAASPSLSSLPTEDTSLEVLADTLLELDSKNVSMDCLWLHTQLSFFLKVCRYVLTHCVFLW